MAELAQLAKRLGQLEKLLVGTLADEHPDRPPAGATADAVL